MWGVHRHAVYHQDGQKRSVQARAFRVQQKKYNHMYIKSEKLTFYIPHAASLKDKRQVCRSLADKTRQRFHASVVEVDTQDNHQTLAIGVAVVSGDPAHVKQSLDTIIRFMEEHADAELIGVRR